MGPNISIQDSAPPMAETIPGVKAEKPQASWLLKTGTVMTTIFTAVVGNWAPLLMAFMGNKIHSLEIAEIIGGVIGLIFFPMIVVLLFQIGKRFRNPRSRWSIYLYTSLFLLFTKIVNGLTKLSEFLG